MIEKLTRYIFRKTRTLAVLAVISLILYYLLRTILLLFSEYSWIDRLIGVALLAGETYILLHAFGFLLSVFKIGAVVRIQTPEKIDFDNAPPVAVIVAARHEPRDVLRQTFITLINLNYPNKHIYLLDDSSDPAFIEEADSIGDEFNITIFRRAERHGAKAGVVNDFIRHIDEKYIAIFDADQNPMPDFLTKTIPYLEQDEKLAFVQTPQFYTNLDAGYIARAATIQQAIFYEAVCEGKSANNAMFCCGTNVVFRKSALEDVGGFDEINITEDFATSVKLHSKGYKSFYYNHVSAFGMAPESLPEYFKQQTRWAAGTISVLRRLARQFLRNPASLTLTQWWEYFLAGTFYFVGWAFFLLMITPILFLTLDIPSYFMNTVIYVVTFMPYYILSLLIFYSAMTKRHYSFSTVYIGTIMGMLSFPVLMKSAILGLFNKRMKFAVTSKGKTDNMPFIKLWPYHIMILLNVVALYMGGIRIFSGEDVYAISVNMFWAGYHIFILLHIYFINRTPVFND